MNWISTFLALILYTQNPEPNFSNSEWLGARKGDPASLVDNVSVIEGDYSEIEVDLTVASPDPLVLSRFYSSRDSGQLAPFGGWRFNPHCMLVIDKQRTPTTIVKGDVVSLSLARVGNPDGSVLSYYGSINSPIHSAPIPIAGKYSTYKINPDDPGVGISNTTTSSLGMWTNLKNNTLTYDLQKDTFKLDLCTEGCRHYIKDPSGKVYILKHEVLPSGNKVFYTLNKDCQPVLIEQKNAAETKVLAWIKIEYGPIVHVEGSDGQKVDYYFQKDPSE